MERYKLIFFFMWSGFYLWFRNMVSYLLIFSKGIKEKRLIKEKNVYKYGFKLVFKDIIL